MTIAIIALVFLTLMLIYFSRECHVCRGRGFVVRKGKRYVCPRCGE